jgi:exonuclease III
VKLVTRDVDSLMVRLPRVLWFLAQRAPDVVRLQAFLARELPAAR